MQCQSLLHPGVRLANHLGPDFIFMGKPLEWSLVQGETEVVFFHELVKSAPPSYENVGAVHLRENEGHLKRCF